MGYIIRYYRDRTGRIQRRRIRKENLNKYADRIVIGYRKPKRIKKSLERVPRKIPRGKSFDLGDYSQIITGFLANGDLITEGDSKGRTNLMPYPITNGPVVWYSNQGKRTDLVPILGRVLYNGHVKVEVLNEMLDRSLNYQGARGQPLHYQDVCINWQYRYELTGVRNGNRTPIGKVLVVRGKNSAAVVRRRAL